MHGVILHLCTRKPMVDEVERYQAGLLQSDELTEDVPWEPYSEKFAETEAAACAARSVMAPQVTVPRSMSSPTHLSEEEEEVYPQCSPILMEHCIAVASCLSQSQAMVELSDDEDLASRLVAAINIESNARNRDGCNERSDETISDTSEEDQAIFGLSTTERGPSYHQRDFGQKVGHWPQQCAPDSHCDDTMWDQTHSTSSGASLQDTSIASTFPNSQHTLLH
jgi:hypothetical protein